MGLNGCATHITLKPGADDRAKNYAACREEADSLYAVTPRYPTHTHIFLREEQGRRPVYGGTAKFQDDPHWRDYILFYEYFHGDNGAGLGASHQTGWSGLVAKFIQLFGSLDTVQGLEGGKMAAFHSTEKK